MSRLLDPLRSCPDVTWSACVLDGVSGAVLDELDCDRVLPTASVGKVLLLASVFEQIAAGTLDRHEALLVANGHAVADSGLLQVLDQPTLSIVDLCRFVGAVSDNLATNVLIDRVGLDAVAATTARLGLRSSALHDVVRNARGRDDPPCLSSGTAGEWAGVMHSLWGGHAVSSELSAAVVDILTLNCDLSMVAAAFGLDPLAHGESDVGVRLCNKTGTNRGTRADIGVVDFDGAGVIAYAVIARWTDGSPAARLAVLDAMRSVGAAIRSDGLGSR